MKGISGQVHVITGGYGGIATSTARLLARAGAKVVITGRNADTGEARAAELSQETGGTVRFAVMDVNDPAQVEACAARIEAEVGPVRGLVANAAFAKVAPALDHDVNDWNTILSTNLVGAFSCAKSFGRRMMGRGGSIVMVSSIGGRTATGPHLAYSASKAGMTHMARVLAVEWAPHGVRINTVEPGHTATDAIVHLQRDAPELAAQLESQIPLGRFLQPEEIGNVIAFLLSDLSSAMTGAAVAADGGFSAK